MDFNLHPERILGPGQSRPRPGERTKTFNLKVTVNGDAPFRWTIKAPTAKQAVKYAKNRWPGCTAIIVK